MSIRFCEYCGKILIPTEKKADRIEDKRIIYSCCNKREEKENSVQNNIVYRNEIKLGQTEVKINNSIIYDPTYARTYESKCEECGFNETIFFQNPNINDPGMKFMYVCCKCGHHWFKKNKQEDKQDNNQN